MVEIVTDMQILSGDDLGPSDASWQDVAGTLAVNMTVYASLLNRARKGDHESNLVFPSIDEVVNG